MSFASRFLGFVFLLSGSHTAQAQEASQLRGEFFEELEYRHIGPVGNRVSAVMGVPGDPNVYYIGAASGGVFKTVDGGVHWDAGVRRPAGPVHRRPGHRPGQPQRGVGRNRGSPHPEQRQHRKWRLQVHGRWREAGPIWASKTRAGSAES